MLDIEDFLRGGDLYRTEYPEGWKFTWRLLTLQEYRVFSALRNSGTLHPLFVYKKVFEKAYLGDLALVNKTIPMGIPMSIGQLVMYLSGDCNFDTLESDIQSIRSLYPEFEAIEVIKRVICTAYSNYSPKELNQMNRLELFRLFVEAEALLKFKMGNSYKPIEFSLPKEEAKPSTAINFDLDNQLLNKEISPLELEDIAEREYKRAKTTKITPDMARKLDSQRRRR